MTRAEMFWRHVDIRSPRSCWLWYGSTFAAGYGRIRRGKITRSAHREAYELTFGKFPEAAMICHRCDNPRCVNPRHLFIGDALSNNRDRQRKGRNGDTRGERHPYAKLNNAAIRIIRARRAAGEILKNIARDFNVTPQTIHYAARGDTWRHLP